MLLEVFPRAENKAFLLGADKTLGGSSANGEERQVKVINIPYIFCMLCINHVVGERDNDCGDQYNKERDLCLAY